jgi:hypothetical protein|eukprot:COSAG06_NODE_408_length_16107_cov_14.957154_5_plen_375_part_00
MGCGDSKPIDVDLVGQPADKSAVFAGGKYVVPPGGPPLTLGWTGKAWDWRASKILAEIFDVRTGEVLFKAETESLGDTPGSDWAVTFSSADGAAVWQLVALSFGHKTCTCLSSAVFECSGELAGINDTDVVLCTEWDPKPTFTSLGDDTATVTGAKWEGDNTIKVWFETSCGKQSDTAKLMWQGGSIDAASTDYEEKQPKGLTGTATFNHVPRDKQLFFGLDWYGVGDTSGIQVAAITQSSKAACTLRWPGAISGQDFYGTYRSTTCDELQLRGLQDRIELAPPGSASGNGPAIAKSANKKRFAAELRRLGRLEEKGKPPPTGPHPLEHAALQKYECFLEVAPGVDAAAVLAFWLARAWLSGKKENLYLCATTQ